LQIDFSLAAINKWTLPTGRFVEDSIIHDWRGSVAMQPLPFYDS
jgi:hypothetical protein